jgi:unsaturated rhamnogalacturonyl hydrolase
MARLLIVLMVSLLSARATFAQTAPATEASIREVMNRVHGYLLTATPFRPINGDTGEAVSLDNMPRNVALGVTDMRIITYEWGVTYSGMLRATSATGDQRYRTYVNERLTGIARMAAHMRANYPTATFDTFPTSVSGSNYSLRRMLFPQNLDDSGSMCAAMIKAHLSGIGSGALRPWIDNYADWVSNRQYRLSDGTFARNQPMPNSVWVDDLYMSVPCLAQMGKLTGDRRYFDEAARQILQFSGKMFVSNSLWMHGWVQGMSPHPAFHWARGNGWALMATVELLTELPKDHPQRTQLINILKAHATALRQRQAPSGLWRQLLNKGASYEETSASGMYVFAFARAIRNGWLSHTTFRPVVERGWSGVVSRVNEIGQVEGTCVGTGIGWDDAHYFNRPTSVTAAHGYGPIFLAGAEIIYLSRAYPNYGTTNANLQFEEAVFED